MSVVPFSRSFRHASLLVVFADFQREYVAAGRPFALKTETQCLAVARRWLEVARGMMLPIAHFRQLRREAWFNRSSTFSEWIDGFRPHIDETLYERDRASCYADTGFADFVNQIRDPLIVLAGLTADQACLATAVEASARGHRMIFLSDCSATTSLDDLDEAQSHRALCALMARYADVATFDELLSEMNSRTLIRSSA
jgi:nicotinamidase-related amidase